MWRAVVGAGVAVALVRQRHRVPRTLLWSDWNKETIMKTWQLRQRLYPSPDQSGDSQTSYNYQHHSLFEHDLQCHVYLSFKYLSSVSNPLPRESPSSLERAVTREKVSFFLSAQSLGTHSYLHPQTFCLITRVCVCLNNRDKLLESCVCTGPLDQGRYTTAAGEHCPPGPQATRIAKMWGGSALVETRRS